MTDAELADIASRARRHEPEAFEQLFDLFFERLRRYAYYKTGDLEMAEDLAAETLTKGLESIDGFEDRGGTVGAWLFGIERNLLARHRESASKAKLVELDDALPAGRELEPESTVLEGIGHEELYRALAALPDEQRDVILLRFMERYDARTVGRLLGKGPGAVRAMQFRAIENLKKALSGGGHDEA